MAYDNDWKKEFDPRTGRLESKRSLPPVPSNALFGVLWGFQCPTCHIRSGHAYIGTHAEAVEQAPTCCGLVAMTPVRIKEEDG